MSHRYQGSYDSPAGSYYQVGNNSTAGLQQQQPQYEHTYPAATAQRSMGYKKQGLAASQPWYKSLYVKWGAPVLLVVAIAAAVGGGVAASRHSSSSNSDAGKSSSGISNNAAAAGSAPVSADANGNPVYSTGTSSASAPAATASSLTSLCAEDNPNYTDFGNYKVRTDHPRLFASKAKWDCLPQQIAKDPYLASWNATIMANATRYAAMDPVQYNIDGGLGGSGVLDIARELQLRTKHWAYAWRMTNDSFWVNRTWTELQVASGNSSESFGNGQTRWNIQHFLDLAEFTLAFAYSYDWMYDAWTQSQREAIRWSITELGLYYGLQSYTNSTARADYGWWQTTNGNWNCVCNGGLTLGALAIATEDTTGIAAQVIDNTVPNAALNCFQAVLPDGTWSETSDYWYFGSTGASQMASGLLTATGSTQGLLTANANYNKTGLFHMYGSGFVQKFNWGDCGPKQKYTATANNMMFWGEQYDIPMYTLYQRDRPDAPEPLAMTFYNPDVSGDWWYNLALDHHFNNPNDDWVSMRSSWTNTSGLYVGMKAGNNSGHQNHNDLDAGDFVIEALGERWAGELCQDNYLSQGYFQGDVQDQNRWLYYRCRTEGQNTLLMGAQNQNLEISPPTNYDTTGDQQSSLDYSVGSNSAVYWWTDMTEAYNTTVKRGVRLLNSRRQVLIQDEIESDETSQWRMHTNATITYSNGNKNANLALNGQSMTVQILGSSNLSFTTLQPTRNSADPPLPPGGEEEPNPGVSVLAINIPSGSQTVEVLFNPQWPGVASSAYVTPSSVALSSWTLTSHNN